MTDFPQIEFAAISVVNTLESHTFTQLLLDIINSRNLSISGFHKYLLEQGYYVEKTSLHRYFNGHRFPPIDILDHLAVYASLSEGGKRVVLIYWQLCKDDYIKLR